MAVDISCSKQPAFATNGMVAASHPLASAAGAETIAAGGNAIDAAVATLFTLTVVEPMMVGIVGGGMAHLRLSNGTHQVIDGLGRAPLAVGPDVYKPISDTMPDYLETEGRENAVGAKAIAAPGSLRSLVRNAGTLRHALARRRHGTGDPSCKPRLHRHTYLSECIDEALPDLVLDPVISSVYLDDDKPLPAGTRLATPEYADTLRAISAEGPSALYGGAVGEVVTTHLAKVGGLLTMTDFTEYEAIEREVVRGTYRDVEIVGPPPPSSGGVHVIQMLNLLEGFDIPSMGIGSPESLHLILEVLKIAFADRAAVMADPAFVDVPTDRLLSKAYADERRADIDLANAKEWTAGVALPGRRTPRM